MTVSMTLYDKIRLAREGAAVERCHTAPHRLRYSVGHHSLDLVNLITLAWQEDHAGALPRAELLVAAAFHDIPERIVGDVPSPIKDLLDGKMEAAEACTLSSLGVFITLTEEENKYLHQGDRLECWLWAVEQVRAGDMNFNAWVAYYSEKWAASSHPIYGVEQEANNNALVPAYYRLWSSVRTNGLPHLASHTLLMIAGLA